MFRTAPGQAPRVQIIEGDCDISVLHGLVGLRLKPYRAPIELHAHHGLITALRAIVGKSPQKTTRPGLGEIAFAVGHYARLATGRTALRKLLKSYVGSSNRSSLSLLSVPYAADETDAVWHLPGPVMWDWGNGAAGWLNTGDAELLSPADLNHWQSAYVGELPRVRVLALPHHGSDKNSNEGLQKLCPEAVLAAHVKAGAKKHPGLDVVAFAGERLASVTDRAGTEMRMHFRKPW